MPKVSMTLTDEDVRKTERLTDELGTGGETGTVLTALNLAEKFVEATRRGGEVLVRYKDGSLHRLVLRDA